MARARQRSTPNLLDYQRGPSATPRRKLLGRRESSIGPRDFAVKQRSDEFGERRVFGKRASAVSFPPHWGLLHGCEPRQPAQVHRNTLIDTCIGAISIL